ncbi:MAG: hypothetical protein HOI95_07325, partial [Chromatiales bacterium]|nr:hypothetical protein [Chromatiales bacterium]
GSATSWDDLEIVTLEIEGTLIRVVSAHTLYLMKRDTVRPKDQNDAQALRRAFGFEDE